MLNIFTSIKNSAKYKWKSWLINIIILMIFIWICAIAIAPLHKINELEYEVIEDSLLQKKFKSIDYSSQLSDLIKEKAFKEALVNLSENDSIQLVINIPECSVNLSMKGVIIHQSISNKINTDRFFEKISVIQNYKLFSQPLKVTSLYATIIKEPIVERNAPNDAKEAANNVWEPDTLIQNPAFVAFQLDHNFNLVLSQETNNTIRDKWVNFKFHNKLILDYLTSSLKNLFCLRKQEYIPTINIKVPADDLRAIYRALPQNAYVVLKM